MLQYHLFPFSRSNSVVYCSVCTSSVCQLLLFKDLQQSSNRMLTCKPHFAIPLRRQANSTIAVQLQSEIILVFTAIRHWFLLMLFNILDRKVTIAEYEINRLLLTLTVCLHHNLHAIVTKTYNGVLFFAKCL